MLASWVLEEMGVGVRRLRGNAGIIPRHRQPFCPIGSRTRCKK